MNKHLEHDTKLVFLGMALHPTKNKTDKTVVIPQMRFYCYQCGVIFQVDTKFDESTKAWKEEIERSFAASQLHTG